MRAHRLLLIAPLLAALSLGMHPLAHQDRTRAAVTQVARQAVQSSHSDDIHVSSTSITPITTLSASRPTELGGATTGSLFASADFIDIIAKSSSTATLNLVYYDVTAAAWAIYGPSCSVTTDLATCRYVTKRGQFYWHVYKSAGSTSACYIEQVYRGSSALGSIEPPVPSGLASVSVTAPIGGDGTSGSPLNMAVASDSVPGYMAAADHALLPSTGQKLALAGSSGTPGAGNVYVTDGDSRMSNSRAPTAHADSHKAGGSDPLLAAPGAIGGGTPAAINGTIIGASTRIETPTIGPNSTQQHTVPAVASDTMCLLAASQTLTNKTLTNPTINAGSGVVVLPAATSPAQTAEGSAVWDSDDDRLTIGTGASRKTLINSDSTLLLPAPATAGKIPIDSGSAWVSGWPTSSTSFFSSAVLVNLYMGNKGNAGSTTLLNNGAARIYGTGTINFRSFTVLTNTGTGSITVQVYKSSDGFTYSAQAGQTRTITVVVGNVQTDSGALADLAVSDGDWILIRVTGYTATVASMAAQMTASGGAVIG